MRTQHARDEQTVTIAGGLAVFAVVVATGLVLLALTGGLSDADQGAGFWLLVAAGVLCGGTYVARHRRQPDDRVSESDE